MCRYRASLETALTSSGRRRVSRIGVPQYTRRPGFETMMRNITLTGGAAPARAYIEELMPDILDGTVEPGRVFDRTIGWTRSPTATRPWPNANR